MFKSFAVVLMATALGSAAQAKTLTVAPGPDAQERLQTALLDAKPGDVVALAAGRFELTDGLSLDVDDVTVKGAGPEATVLSFKDQKGAGEGLLITSDKVTVRDFGVEDTRGDGIKSKGADQISFINVRVEWTGGPKETNGAYGVYPVSSTNVLIDRVGVKGASDAGIYVGQSKNIVVKRSRAEFNVAGIEIENSMNADVFDNVATRNAGGILVFDLPNLPQMGGHSTRLFRNKIVQNDTPNFAPKGNIVANVPTGTGVMIMANRNVHVFENEIDNNASTGVILVSYTQKFDDKTYNPLPRDVVVRDNKLGKNGFDPKFAGGALIKMMLKSDIPPVVWDGVTSFPGTTEPVRVRLTDGPVLNLRLPGPGEIEKANPAVTATAIVPEPAPQFAEPAAVVLPKAQADLGAEDDRMKRLAAYLAALCCLGAAPQPPAVSLETLLAEAPAPKLADYRLFADDGGRRPNAGMTPYALNTPLFSDYAEKSRFLYLPAGAKAQYRADGVLEFPVGAALVKTFAYPADMRRPNEDVRYLETRLLIHKRSGWVALAYVWNAEQTEAVLKRAGARLPVSFVDSHGHTQQIDYAVPNQNQCKECHQLDKTLTPIGPKAANLNGDFAYPEGRENQLAHWTRKGVLAGAPKPAAAPRAARWDDPAEPLEARARAYLDANCAHCHGPRAIASNSGLFLGLNDPTGPHLGIGKGPVAAGRGSGNLKVGIAPGDPDASILVYRMASTEPGVMMPELGRSLTHEEGLKLVRDWIAGMKAP